MRLDDETDHKTSADVERSMSRREFTKLLGGGIGALSLSGALAPFANAASARAAKAALSISVQSSDQPALVAAMKLYSKMPGAATLTMSGISDNDWQVVLPRLFSAGTVGDIVEIQPGNGEPNSVDNIAPNGYLLDLSHEPWVTKIPKGVLPVCKVGGKVYMAPVTGGVMVAFYNKAMFKSVGVTVPKTWPQFLQVCAKLKAAGKIPIWLDASDASNGGVNPVFISYPLVASTNAGLPNFNALHKAGKITFATSGWVQALTRFKLLNDSGYFSPNSTGGAPLSQLTNDAAMYFFVSEGLATAATGFGMANTGAFCLPNATTAAGLVACAGSGAGYGISAKTKNPAAAKALLNALCTPKLQQVYNKIDGGVPLLPSAAGAVPTLFNDYVLPALAPGKRTATYYDQQWPNAEVIKALETGSQGLIDGSQTVADVVAAMDNAYNQGSA